ncbi:hypothetical protein [Paraburkholderia bannensis]|uniref:hypothetical protein n=1 Tax=Paraburkholderia bannensis TaxID=765414 RepID=UPI002AB7DEE9|nr:hypothetical protein [Paraburkholderia bannensis]
MAGMLGGGMSAQQAAMLGRAGMGLMQQSQQQPQAQAAAARPMAFGNAPQRNPQIAQPMPYTQALQQQPQQFGFGSLPYGYMGA